ncbi:hypothetical protein [Amycolatopsis rubida]|uniref:Uncharacterized protein n=1 Tax=Amycolatopsis rubida TaxID=112413 RepID=A0A1I5IJB4_9PSEU|nr:hypothetical protein [Amycolatopsis rubida]SFO60320.1 hypothetical protein SAMN05421854_102490 [Amycolatopsis rubida]
MPDQTENASERPNAGQHGAILHELSDAIAVEATVPVEPGQLSRLHELAVRVRQVASEVHADRRRADAAEAKLKAHREGTEAGDDIEPCGWYEAMWRERHRAEAVEAKLKIRDDHHRMELAQAGELLRAAEAKLAENDSDWTRLKQVLGIGTTERLPSNEAAVKAAAALYIERNEAREKLDEVRADVDRGGVGSLGEAIALALGDAYAGETFSDPTFERGTEAILGVLRERLAEPVADREDEIGFLPNRIPRDARTWLTALLFDASSNNWDVDTCQAKAEGLIDSWKGLEGSAVTDREEPASDWDVEADTHRISEDHEEPAGTVDTCEEHGHPVRTCTYCITDPVQRGEIDESRARRNRPARRSRACGTQATRCRTTCSRSVTRWATSGNATRSPMWICGSRPTRFR